MGRLPLIITFILTFAGTFHVVLFLHGPQETTFSLLKSRFPRRLRQGLLARKNATGISAGGGVGGDGSGLIPPADVASSGDDVSSGLGDVSAAAGDVAVAGGGVGGGGGAAEGAGGEGGEGGEGRGEAAAAAAVVRRPIDEAAALAAGEAGLEALPAKPRFHTAMTCDSSGYSKWQSRIMYYYYKKFRNQPGSGMGDFTRVLHTGTGDELVEEIPTYIVDPLPESLLQGYVVLNRPYAFEQWVSMAPIEEDYIWMAEPDHLILRPIPNLAEGDRPAAFPFFYIEPKKQEKVLRKWFTDMSRSIDEVDPVGNSPVIIKKEQLKQLAPLWKNISMEMKHDKEADKAFGWVLEMYAYAVSAAVLGIKHVLQKNWMIQPPWDTKLGDSYLIHYTYGCDFTLDGEAVIGKVGPWHFDKRDHMGAPPRNLSLPPKGAPESVVKLVSMINDATENIPGWKAGVE